MFKYLFLFFFILNFNLNAEVIKKMEVTGNDRISEETIRVYGEILFDKNYTAFDLNQVLKNLYETDFFEDIKVSIDGGIIKVVVKEYPIINSIVINGEKSKTVTKGVLDQLQLKSKASFIENKLEADLRGIKKIYSSLGFNFVSVETKVEKFDNNRINLIYFLDKGKKTNISKIYFTGNKKIKEKRLRDVIVSEEAKFWKVLTKNTHLNSTNIELDKRLLINYYKSLGYYDVQVLSNSAEISKDNFTTLTYTINAGTRFRVNKISTNVSEVLDKKIFLPLQSKYTKIIGKYYSPFAVKKLLDELDLLIANNDLQFIEHSVNEILEGNSIELKINVYEGKKLIVEKINIKGNSVTDESVIRAEFLLDEGDPFSTLKLDQTIAKLKARNLFGEVKKNITDGSRKDQKIIEISVEEKPTGEISAGAGIGTSGGSFAFNVTENNWLGKGVSVSTMLDISADTFTGEFSVSDPNYNYSGNSLSYFVNRTSNDKSKSGYKNIIYTTGMGTKFEQYNNIYLSPSLTYSYDDLQVLNTASESLKKQKGTFSDLSFGYGILLDERDKAYGTTDGYISSFAQSLPIYADSPSIGNTYSFSQYKSFSPNALGNFKFFASAINGLSNKDVRLNKRLNLSSSKMRGFKSGQIGPKDGSDYIGGNYLWASNFQLSVPNFLPVETKTDIGLFLDLGNVWSVDYDKTLDDSNKIRSSVGVNTSFISPVGPLSFVFSKNITKASTDITESFNFRLGTTF